MEKQPKKLWLLCLTLGITVNIVHGTMEVDLFVHKDKFGKSLTLDIGDKACTNVPRLWANLTMSVDTHGACVQFYDQKSCKGRIAVIQPFHTVHQMDLSLIEFHNAIESLSPCGPRVPSGRYVIQSAVDASILTVMKHANDFARVNTLPPQAFIPKAQQWEISEKQTNEYDIMPRIHETNYPVTYDGRQMKEGSFVRKVWKIESVGRGRYVIKSEWSQKCLYKTRIRTVEEHDCRAWSPNQEWVLRPLIAPTAAPPTPDPQLADGVNFQVPSKVVDKYLKSQKRLREKKKKRKGSTSDSDSSEHSAAYLQPYRIRSRDDKDSEESEENGQSDSPPRYQYQQPSPPDPQVIYSYPSPIFGMGDKPHPLSSKRNHPPGYNPKVLSYMDGMMPIYEDAKQEDPVFPDFLLHAASSQEDDERPAGSAPKYSVTRSPLRIPEPTGHPDYIPGKKKYDGRVKDTLKAQKDEDEEDEEDETASDEAGGNESEEEDQEQVEGDSKVPQEGEKEEFRPPGGDVREGAQEDEEEGESEEEEEDDEPEQAASSQPKESEVEEGDDPAKDVASFMKLLFKGISTKMNKEEKGKEEMIDMFEK